MKSSLNDIARDENRRVGTVRQYENIIELFTTHDSLCGFPVVTFQDAAEFALASHSAFCLRNEVLVEHRFASPYTAMRSLLVIVFQPHAKDVVELSSTKANEVIQGLAFGSSDEAFAKCICHRSARRNLNRSHVGLFPEHVESA